MQIAVTLRGNFAFAGDTNQTTVYDHNALNQIIDITQTGAVTRTLTPVWTAGNLTSDGERSFGYDPFNRLTSVTGGGQSDVDLGYACPGPDPGTWLPCARPCRQDDCGRGGWDVWPSSMSQAGL